MPEWLQVTNVVPGMHSLALTLFMGVILPTVTCAVTRRRDDIQGAKQEGDIRGKLTRKIPDSFHPMLILSQHHREGSLRSRVSQKEAGLAEEKLQGRVLRQGSPDGPPRQLDGADSARGDTILVQKTSRWPAYQYRRRQNVYERPAAKLKTNYISERGPPAYNRLATEHIPAKQTQRGRPLVFPDHLRNASFSTIRGNFQEKLINTFETWRGSVYAPPYQDPVSRIGPKGVAPFNLTTRTSERRVATESHVDQERFELLPSASNVTRQDTLQLGSSSGRTARNPRHTVRGDTDTEGQSSEKRDRVRRDSNHTDAKTETKIIEKCPGVTASLRRGKEMEEWDQLCGKCRIKPNDYDDLCFDNVTECPWCNCMLKSKCDLASGNCSSSDSCPYGWKSRNCHLSVCPQRTFAPYYNCSKVCKATCLGSELCHPITGECFPRPGISDERQYPHTCPRHRYGKHCNKQCHCSGGRVCHSLNGQCPDFVCDRTHSGMYCSVETTPFIEQETMQYQMACGISIISFKIIVRVYFFFTIYRRSADPQIRKE